MRQLFSRSIGKPRGFKAGRKAARPGPGARPKSATLPAKPRPFAAVSIEPGAIACDEVQRHAGRRLLQKNAPVLPVPGCDQAECGCRYRKFDDRRSGTERRVPFAHSQLTSFMTGKLAERKLTDRRKRQDSRGPRGYFNDHD